MAIEQGNSGLAHILACIQIPQESFLQFVMQIYTQPNISHMTHALI